jgi:hypothetical protein
MVLPGPRQERPSGVVGPRHPLAKGYGGLLRLGGEAHKGIAQGELGYAEVLFKQFEERLVATDVPVGEVEAAEEERRKEQRDAKLRRSQEEKAELEERLAKDNARRSWTASGGAEAAFDQAWPSI